MLNWGIVISMILLGIWLPNTIIISMAALFIWSIILTLQEGYHGGSKGI